MDVIEIPLRETLGEMIEDVRLEWAKRNIRSEESYEAFARRIGVSYRTVLRWFQNEGRKGRERAESTKQAHIAMKRPVRLPLVHQAWTHEQIAQYSGPVVYLVVKDSIVQYVGCSAKGARRILDRGHHQHGLIRTAASVFIYPCQDHAFALRLERELINEYQPPYNNKPH